MYCVKITLDFKRKIGENSFEVSSVSAENESKAESWKPYFCQTLRWDNEEYHDQDMFKL